MIKELQIKTSKRNELIDITQEINELLEGIDEGTAIIHIPHTTAAITINENADPDVKKDIINRLNEIAPKNKNYLHAEGNSDSHIKATLVGQSLNIIIQDGRAMLGRWQGIFFCEFDGPRKRKIILKI